MKKRYSMEYSLRFALFLLFAVYIMPNYRVTGECSSRRASPLQSHPIAEKTTYRQDETTNLQCVTTNQHKRQRRRPFLTNETATLRGGGWKCIPAGWHPYGYQITALAEEFLAWEGSKESDLGRFLISFKNRKTRYAARTAWLEVLKNSKSAQAMRIYKSVDDLIRFCLKAKFID